MPLGYLLTHNAISALICQAATAAGIDPDRVKFKRTVRIIRRRAADPGRGMAGAPAAGPRLGEPCRTRVRRNRKASGDQS